MGLLKSEVRIKSVHDMTIPETCDPFDHGYMTKQTLTNWDIYEKDGDDLNQSLTIIMGHQ